MKSSPSKSLFPTVKLLVVLVALTILGWGVWSWASLRNKRVVIPAELVRSAKELPAMAKGAVCVVRVGNQPYFVNRKAEKNTILEGGNRVAFSGKDKSTEEFVFLSPGKPISIIDSNAALRERLQKKDGVIIGFYETEILVFDLILPQNYMYQR